MNGTAENTAGNNMSIYEPRCLVCGSPMEKGAPFEKDVRNSEVCSDLCYKIYMHNDEDEDDERKLNGK